MSHFRYQTTLLWVGALCAAVLALSAQAASFDCSRASTKVEHLICDNPELSRLDDEMGAKFRSALDGGVDRAELVGGQKQWLAQRNSCQSAACVKSAYEQRLAELSVVATTGKPQNTSSEQDKVQQIMTSHHFSRTMVREKSSESFCKAFLQDFRAMRGVTFLKPVIESDSYSDKRWDAYKARCPNIDIFGGFSCDPQTQEYVDSLPEKDRRAEEMHSCQQFRCTQTFRLFKVAGNGYTGPAFNAFYCEHMRGALNYGETDQEMPGGYSFVSPHNCSANASVATTDPYDYGMHHPVDNHNGIIIYKGKYFVFDLVELSGADPASPTAKREYDLSLSGDLDLTKIKVPELEPPTISPICAFSTISKSKNK